MSWQVAQMSPSFFPGIKWEEKEVMHMKWPAYVRCLHPPPKQPLRWSLFSLFLWWGDYSSKRISKWPKKQNHVGRGTSGTILPFPPHCLEGQAMDGLRGWSHKSRGPKFGQGYKPELQVLPHWGVSWAARWRTSERVPWPRDRCDARKDEPEHGNPTE